PSPRRGPKADGTEAKQRRHPTPNHTAAVPDRRRLLTAARARAEGVTPGVRRCQTASPVGTPAHRVGRIVLKASRPAVGPLPALILRSTANRCPHASIGISLGAPPGGAGRATSGNVASGREFLLFTAGTTGGADRGGLRRRRTAPGSRRVGAPPPSGLVPRAGRSRRRAAGWERARRRRRLPIARP